MSIIWEHYPRGGSELLTVLALADWSNDSGESLRPSIRAIARKTRLSEKQARRYMHAMLRTGLLEVIANKNGGNPGTPRHYRLRLDRIGATPPTDGSGQLHGPLPPMGLDPSHGCPSTPPTHGSLTVIEPSLNRQRALKPKTASVALDAAGRWSGITYDHLARWKAANPAVDVSRELAAAAAWLAANPDRHRKSNHERFIVNWLGRAQDRAPRSDLNRPKQVAL